MSRDRGGGYGEAAAKALPEAIQVADRWHLMENASTAFLDAVRRSILPIHSHPGGLFDFSARDDASDQIVMLALFHAHGDRHGSAVMTPDGAVRARLYREDLSVWDVPLVSVVGDDIRYWWSASGPAQRRPMAFTGAMTHELGRLCPVVIGVSGTGSLVAEQLAPRLRPCNPDRFRPGRGQEPQPHRQRAHHRRQPHHAIADRRPTESAVLEPLVTQLRMQTLRMHRVFSSTARAPNSNEAAIKRPRF